MILFTHNVIHNVFSNTDKSFSYIEISSMTVYMCPKQLVSNFAGIAMSVFISISTSVRKL